MMNSRKNCRPQIIANNKGGKTNKRTQLIEKLRLFMTKPKSARKRKTAIKQETDPEMIELLKKK